MSSKALNQEAVGGGCEWRGLVNKPPWLRGRACNTCRETLQAERQRGLNVSAAGMCGSFFTAVKLYNLESVGPYDIVEGGLQEHFFFSFSLPFRCCPFTRHYVNVKGVIVGWKIPR